MKPDNIKYVGEEMPVVEHVVEAGRFEDSDNDAADPEQAGY